MCVACGNRAHVGVSRRGVLGGALAGLLAGPALADNAVKTSLTPEAALARMMAGHRTYLAGKVVVGDYAAGRAERAKGQAPIAAILSCADSRVIPELVFDRKPGELFVTRVAGNVEDEDLVASLEYGVAVLGIPLVLVMGHSGCGAVSSAIKVFKDHEVLPGHLPGLIARITPAVEAAAAKKPADLMTAAVAENVRMTVGRLARAAPILGAGVSAGTLKVVGGVYDVATGKIALV